MKKHINNGHTGDWAYNAMRGYYRERSLRYVLKDCVNDIKISPSCDHVDLGLLVDAAERLAGKTADFGFSETDGLSAMNEEDRNEDESEQKSRYHQFKTFDTVALAKQAIEGSDHLSGVVADGKFYMAIKSDRFGKMSFLEIRPKNYYCNLCGADYFSYESVPEEELCSIRHSEFAEYFLMLPIDTEVIQGSGRFYLLTSQWKEVVHEGGVDEFTLGLPKIPGVVYSS